MIGNGDLNIEIWIDIFCGQNYFTKFYMDFQWTGIEMVIETGFHGKTWWAEGIYELSMRDLVTLKTVENLLLLPECATYDNNLNLRLFFPGGGVFFCWLLVLELWSWETDPSGFKMQKHTHKLGLKVESQVAHNGWGGSASSQPEEEARRSNMRHRPVGLGVQGAFRSVEIRCRGRMSFEPQDVRMFQLLDPLGCKFSSMSLRWF